MLEININIAFKKEPAESTDEAYQRLKGILESVGIDWTLIDIKEKEK